MTERKSFVKPTPPPSERLIVVLLGASGAGKTTVVPYLSKYLQVPDIRTVDLVDEEIARGTEMGDELADVKATGRTHSDKNLMLLVRRRVAEEDCRRGFLLSDFPINIGQCQTFDQFLIAGNEKEKLRIIELVLPDNVLEARCAERWVHVASGRPYGVKNCTPESYTDASETPSGENMKDDITGEALARLETDHRLLVPKNIFSYHLGTEPILKHFGPEYCTQIDATGDVVHVVASCCKVLNETVLKPEKSFADRLDVKAPLPEDTNAQDAALRVRVVGDKIERQDAYHSAVNRNGGAFAENRWK